MLACLALPSLAAEESIPFFQPPNTPYLNSPQLTLDSSDFNTISLKIKANQAGSARLMWANNYDPQFNQAKSVWFYVKKGSHSYYFNLPSQNPNWFGWLKGLLVYPENNLPIELQKAKLTSGGWLTNLLSGWQEYWGPKGRLVIGSTINLIPSSSLWGRSINLYLYWATALFFGVAFILNFFKQRPNKKKAQTAVAQAFKQTARQTLILAIIFWLGLTLNSDYNFWQIFKDHLGRYAGKTLAQKRAVAYGQEYYDFLLFAQQKLPQKPVEFGLISSNYAPELQARIFLVPHIYTADFQNQSCQYLLVFKPSQEQLATLKNYASYAILNPSAFIMKRHTIK
ncbi:hypothetical protein COT42_08565 [Candidatus Saganbacteria bacterium CG08_land_8_20_14_0_20_45_16]|uniref:Uncharacterized protein n=1 Tax=Candidatus Saganbacteria bacterium CG08_land_8_20_14_0_20_45_16 TaxID=2014293 RepID=A0A2H0XTX0_UNCSA|nr:MAG: hypothetical protein COT42_08565 [Candidatus Saganbacteria bacterium CG08_land_8_20_14_0_20_45_16]